MSVTILVLAIKDYQLIQRVELLEKKKKDKPEYTVVGGGGSLSTSLVGVATTGIEPIEECCKRVDSLEKRVNELEALVKKLYSY